MFDGLKSNKYESGCLLVLFLEFADDFANDIFLLFLYHTIKLYELFNLQFSVLMCRRKLLLFEPFCDPFDHFLLDFLYFKIVFLKIRIRKLLFIEVKRLSLVVLLYFQLSKPYVPGGNFIEILIHHGLNLFFLVAGRHLLYDHTEIRDTRVAFSLVLHCLEIFLHLDQSNQPKDQHADSQP